MIQVLTPKCIVFKSGEVLTQSRGIVVGGICHVAVIGGLPVCEYDVNNLE
jgi:mannitol-specific phosphotransferase system IIBC component